MASSSWAELSKRATSKETATAVLAATIAAGLLVLVLLFLALFILARRSPHFKAWTARSRTTRSTGELYRERNVSRFTAQGEKPLRRQSTEPVKPDAAVTAHGMDATRDGDLRATPIEYAPQLPYSGPQLSYGGYGVVGLPATTGSQQLQQHQYWTLRNSTVELPSASTDTSIPPVVEVRRPRNSRLTGRWQPPVYLPPLDTQPAELVGSDESRYPPSHPVFQGTMESWYRPSSSTTTSISPVGHESGRAAADELAYATCSPSPASTIAPPPGSHTQIPTVGDEPWNTPYTGRQSHSRNAVGTSGPSPSSARLWTINESL